MFAHCVHLSLFTVTCTIVAWAGIFSFFLFHPIITDCATFKIDKAGFEDHMTILLIVVVGNFKRI